MKQYDTDGNDNVRIKKPENIPKIVLYRKYKGGLITWTQDDAHAFTELVIIGKRLRMMMHLKLRRFIHSLKITLSGKSFVEACILLTWHANWHDQEKKLKAARQIQYNQTSLKSKKETVKIPSIY
jgi:hypothetical protein